VDAEMDEAELALVAAKEAKGRNPKLESLIFKKKKNSNV